MSKVKVLTVQFDVTYLSKDAINSLLAAATAQAEEVEIFKDGEPTDQWVSADVLNTSVREVETDDL